ncbi:MAG: HD domain-containing protein [Gemmatimonadaceae bacterium]|nr:HD domain-containing protein [Gemmatimonadaceae bacterium]MDQ3517664.1 HD domain-containing protein [Gemmatimonadota bacterium]
MKVIRDPLWNNIRVDPLTLKLIDTRLFQRLRYIRQLGHAYLVYPGATHSRFEHALGAYHLARQTLAILGERGELAAVRADDIALIRTAALLHDIGHYPFSHALEEIGVVDHEEVAGPLLSSGKIAAILRAEIASDAPERVHALMCGKSSSPLQGLISGSLDLDKIEYLKRDALMCGVPYGEIDVDRLINSLTIVTDPESGELVMGVLEKGLSALESLLFAKHQMYRNVYWHHAVRGATAMYKRLVYEALNAGIVDARELVGLTDEGLLNRLEAGGPQPLLSALRERQLYKRALDLPAAELEEGWGEWIASDRNRTVAAENALAAHFGLRPGELLIDYPTKPRMLGVDLLVLRQGGGLRKLTAAGWAAEINLPSLSDELYRSARRLRVFVARPIDIADWALLDMLRTAGQTSFNTPPTADPAQGR